MTPAKTEGGCWPTAQQELLLRAALLRGRNGVEAWEKWVSSVDINRLDAGSFRLLPQLYRNLQAQGVAHPLMGKFKGVYRRTWYHNQLMFRDAANLLRSFQDAGIKTLILKGAALVLLHYKEFGLRPMDDFDFLVRTKQAREAMTLLKKLGWTNGEIPNLIFTHSHAFKKDGAYELDLHWHALAHLLDEDADDDFWDGAVSTEIFGVRVDALNPADQLLTVCAHGAKWNPIPPLRWVVDASVILNTSPDFDWDRLVAQARKRRLAFTLKLALNYLHEVVGAPIPSNILRCVQTLPTSRAERLSYEGSVKSPAEWRPVLTLWLLLLALRLRFQSYSRGARNVNLRRRLIGFVELLKSAWGVERLWQVVFYAGYKGARRIMGMRN